MKRLTKRTPDGIELRNMSVGRSCALCEKIRGSCPKFNIILERLAELEDYKESNREELM